jgi:hypothetical protein
MMGEIRRATDYEIRLVNLGPRFREDERILSDSYRPGEGTSAGSSAGTNRARSRRAGMAR